GVFHSPSASVGDEIDGTLDFVFHLLFSWNIEIMTGRKRGGKRNTKQTKRKSRKKVTPPLEEHHVESLSTGNSDDLSAHENETDHLSATS
ncbi:hypothetical protein HID58_079650, partial [Brassica napus]